MSQRDEFAEQAPDDWPLFKLIVQNRRDSIPYAGLGTVGTLVTEVVSNVDMLIIGLAFDAMFNDRSYNIPLIPSTWIPEEAAGQLLFTVGLLIGFKIVEIVTGFVSRAAWNVVAQRLQHRLRVNAFDTVQRLEMSFFDEQRTGSVISVLNNDVNNLENFLTRTPRSVLFVVATLGSSLVFMLLLNWQLAVIAFLFVPVIVIINARFAKMIERREGQVRRQEGALNAVLQTVVDGIAVVKALGGERDEIERVTDSSDAHKCAGQDAVRVNASHIPTLRFIAGIGFALTFLVGTQWTLHGQFWLLPNTLTAGELIPFIYYAQNLVIPLQVAATTTQSYEQATAAAKRILGIQSMEPTTSGGDTLDTDINGEVTYDSVSFSYPGSEMSALSDVSFDVPAGETVGLVGTTGAGKSTIVKLLLQFYDIGEGTISIDGIDIESLSASTVRNAVGYVPQDPYLFRGSVYENIGYGMLNADDEEIVAAAKRANAHDFITQLDNGYDTDVGDRGEKLSGGQRQRVAIARAILRDPPILILDEATSQVDNRAEVIIQQSLERLNKDRTTLMIAHRLSTVRNADEVLVVDDGQIVEQGTHDSLLNRGGQYEQLWQRQIGDRKFATSQPKSGD